MILDKTSKALYTTLNGGTALTALLAGTTSIYDTQAPDNATLPYIVFSHDGGGKENTDANKLEDNRWYIRAYSSVSAKEAIEIFGQFDALLHRQTPVIPRFSAFWVVRDQNITLLDNTPNGKIWNAGGIYRIRTGIQGDWYVSTTGTATAEGTLSDPLDIATAIGASSPVKPGDTIWLRAGTYTPLVAGETGTASINGVAGIAGKGVYTFKINGTAAEVITIRSYPGEWAKISGAVHITYGNSSFIRMRNMEVAAIPTTRVFATSNDEDTPDVYITGAGCQFINCYFHEFGSCFFYPTLAGGTNIIHGCIFGNCGTWTNSQVSGYCIYTHNLGGSDFLIQKNALFGSVHDYNINPHSDSTQVTKYQIDDNILFGGGIALGSYAAGPNTDNYIRRNYIYGPAATPGVTLNPRQLRITSYNNVDDANGEEVDLIDNYAVSCGGTSANEPLLLQARNINSSGNTIVDRGTGVIALIRHSTPTGAITRFTWDTNTYYTDRANPFYSNQSGGFVRYSLANWQALTGYDANSTVAGTLPTTNVTKVTANEYEAGRGQIAVFNWEGSGTVNVDISSLNIPNGASCRLNNILNYRVEYTDFTASGGTISIPMPGWTQGTPTAYDVPLTWHASPGTAFWMFEIETLA